MIPYRRFFIFITLLFLSLVANAKDHIICSLTNSEIPATVQAGQTYSNTYTCINTYPNSFPALQLAGAVLGNSAGTSVTGSCATQKIASGGSCQFMLNVQAPNAGKQTFLLEVSAGSLYYLKFPEITITVGSSSAKITWPGFDSGQAIADVTTNGVGWFVPDATDSSGHTVKYTFKIISGPGTIVGFQTGYLTLAGVDSTTVIQVTATADDAAAVTGTPFTVQISPVPIKVIAFYNNSTETIYPIIESPTHPVNDQWMQGIFSVSDISVYRFIANKVYRAYVNGTVGIAPGQTAVVYVPFYSNLVANPSGGSVADQYADWWNAMRVYLYDVQSNVVTSQSYANGSPLVLPAGAPQPTCISGCTAPISFVSADAILPTNDPYQLTEYTFASVIPSSPPYPTYLSLVNYNISGVDQVYLSAAMEPFGSNLVGYKGSVTNLTDFRSALTTFVAETNWPLYANLPYPRVPSAYIALVGGGQLTNNSAVTTLLTDNWNNCIAASDPNCVTVNNMFNNNWTSCGNAGSPPIDDLLQHIYGYASFCAAQTLPSSGTDFDAYIALQYNYLSKPPGYLEDFNPYTQLIHQTLNMNIYAFSVDDAEGFIKTTGNGLVITVGGSDGLLNQQQYKNDLITKINPGVPTSSPFFTNFGVCCPSSGDTPDCAGTAPNPFPVGESITIQYPQSYYPCRITLQDSASNVYQFTLTSAASPQTPLSLANIMACSAPSNPNWCTQFSVSNPPTNPYTIVGTGAP